jgi:DNA-binding SARP family transcriptional activator
MHVSLLGNLIVTRNGGRIPVPSAKQRTLLALLSLSARQPVATETIMQELWPERDQVATPGTLRTHVFELRKLLFSAGKTQKAKSLLRTVNGGYQLADDEVRLDTDDFGTIVAAGHRALRAEDYLTAGSLFGEALEVWRGPMLADVPPGPRLEAARRQFEESKLLVHGYKADIKLRLGLHREMLPDLAGLVQAHPWDEGFALRYMVALYRSERRADALTHFQKVRRKLREDLGLDPSRRLQEVHTAILNAHASIELPQLA